MTRDNPRMGGDPYEPNDATAHVDRDPTNLDAYETVRVPSNIHLARYRYATDPLFNHVVDAAVRHLDQFETVDDVVGGSPGKRIRASKALIGTASEPGEWGAGAAVEVVFEDDDLARFAEWVDEPVSAFATHETPTAIEDAKRRATGDAYAAISGYEDAWKAGDLSRREFEDRVGRVVQQELPTPNPPDDREVEDTFDPKRRGTPWRRYLLYALAVVAFVVVTILLVSP